jgi:hypothetical protein
MTATDTFIALPKRHRHSGAQVRSQIALGAISGTYPIVGIIVSSHTISTITHADALFYYYCLCNLAVVLITY